jgi:hypothetical protein
LRRSIIAAPAQAELLAFKHQRCRRSPESALDTTSQSRKIDLDLNLVKEPVTERSAQKA